MMELGYPVQPCLVTIVDGKKHFALPKGWQLRGATREEVIAAFADRRIDPGLGRDSYVLQQRANAYMIPCQPAGLAVADLDMRSDGISGIKTWGDRPQGGLIVRTPRGGLHYYFENDSEATTVEGLLPGVDIRAYGGGVLGPGSLDGKYEILHEGPRPFPPWSSTGLQTKRPKKLKGPGTAVSTSGFFDGVSENVARKIIDDKLTEVAEHVAFKGWDGFRTTLMRAALTLGGYVGSNFISYDVAQKALEDSIRIAGQEPNDDDLKWIEQGLEDGARSPFKVMKEQIVVTHRPVKRPFALELGNEKYLSEDFWEARRVLRHIRDTARQRGRGADGVLGAVLARLSSLIPGHVKVDTGVGMPTSLNYFSILMGPSSSGKTTSRHLAEAMFPFGYDVDSHDHPLGSGQGLVAAYGAVVDDEFRQLHDRAFFHMDEGAALLALAKQRESTHMATLRTAWTGTLLGQKNANAERDRRVKDYSMGLVIGLQPGHAAELLRDIYVDDGTLQRFVWFSTDKHMVPTKRPRQISTVTAMPWDLNTAFDPMSKFVIPDHLKDQIYELDRDESRAEEEAHSVLLRVRTACLLAVLDGRHSVNDEDWALAGAVMAASVAVMASVRQTVAQRRKAAQEAADARRIESEIRKTDALEKHQETKVEQFVLRVVERVKASPGVGRGRLRNAMSSPTYREVAETAIERALDRGLIRTEKGDKIGERLYPQ